MKTLEWEVDGRGHAQITNLKRGEVKVEEVGGVEGLGYIPLKPSTSRLNR